MKFDLKEKIIIRATEKSASKLKKINLHKSTINKYTLFFDNSNF